MRGKWAFRITLDAQGSWALKESIATGQNIGVLVKSYYWNASYIDLDYLEKLRKSIKALKCDNELLYYSSYVDIFLNDRTDFDKLVKKFKNTIYTAYSPASDEEFEYLSSNSKKRTLCDKYPFTEYQYRVFITSKLTESQKENYDKFFDGKDSYKVPASYKHFLSNNSKWTTTNYVYVRDEKTLAMATLMLGQSITRVEQFVLRSEINTQSG